MSEKQRLAPEQAQTLAILNQSPAIEASLETSDVSKEEQIMPLLPSDTAASEANLANSPESKGVSAGSQVDTGAKVEASEYKAEAMVEANSDLESNESKAGADSLTLSESTDMEASPQAGTCSKVEASEYKVETMAKANSDLESNEYKAGSDSLTLSESKDMVASSQVDAGVEVEADAEAETDLGSESEAAEQISDYADLCKLLQAQHPKALLLLQLTDLFFKCAVSDPMDGQGLYVDQDTFLEQLYQQLKTDERFSAAHCSDRLSWMWTFIQDAVRIIMYNPHTVLLREHRDIPLHFVREVDTSTMIWLARRSGRTLREKMQGRNTILAVSRHMEINTLENRLFKAVITEFQDLFDLKCKALHFEDPAFQELSSRVGAWLHSDEAQQIKPWDNLEPNNLLLSDRQYHKIWMAWNWLKELDQKLQCDYADVDTKFLQMLFWALAASLHANPEVACLSLPCEFDMQRLETKAFWPLGEQASRNEQDSKTSLAATAATPNQSDTSASAQDLAQGLTQDKHKTSEQGAATLQNEQSATSDSTFSSASSSSGTTSLDGVASPSDTSEQARVEALSQPGLTGEGLEPGAGAANSLETSSSTNAPEDMHTLQDADKDLSPESLNAPTDTLKLAASSQSTAEAKLTAKRAEHKLAFTPHKLYRLDGLLKSSQQDSSFVLTLDQEHDLISLDCTQLDFLLLSKVHEQQLLTVKLPRSFYALWREYVEHTPDPIAALNAALEAPAQNPELSLVELQSLEISWSGLKATLELWLQNLGVVSKPLETSIHGTSTHEATLQGSSTLATTQGATIPGTSTRAATHGASTLDLSNWQPRFKTDANPISWTRYKLLMQFVPNPERNKMLLDVGLTRGLLLSPQVQICSTADVFLREQHREISDSDLSLVLYQFLTKLRSDLKCQRLYYVIPDGLHEFSLRTLYRQINHFYSDAMPLPRSIAAVLAYQWHHPETFASLKEFVVLVVSLLGEQYVFTPVKGTYTPQLQQLLPESHGLSWERFPSKVVNSIQLKQIVPQIFTRYPEQTAAIRLTPADLCALQDDLTFFIPPAQATEADLNVLGGGLSEGQSLNAKSLGSDLSVLEPASSVLNTDSSRGLDSAGADLASDSSLSSASSVLNTDSSRGLGGADADSTSASSSAALNLAAEALKIAEAPESSGFWQYLTLDQTTVTQTLQKLAAVDLDSKIAVELVQNKWFEGLPVYCLYADCQLGQLQLSQLHGQFTHLGQIDSLDANIILSQYEQLLPKAKLGEIELPYLWKDHLPELFLRASQNGTLCYVPLVQNSTIMPRFGETIELNRCNFILPANQAKFYHFPLTQSEGGEKLRYEVQIRSDAFPLSQAVPCTLHMSYTYGAEQPYRLKVLASNPEKAPFTELETEWIEANDIKRPSPVPQLPVCKTASLYELASEANKSAIKQFLLFIQLCQNNLDFIAGSDCVEVVSDRHVNYVMYIDPKSKLFDGHLTTPTDQTIWVYEDDRPKLIRALRKNKGVTIVAKRNYSSSNSDRDPFTLLSRFDIVVGRSFDAFLSQGKRSGTWRYCAHKIWENGRSFLKMCEQYEETRELSESQTSTVQELKACINEQLDGILEKYLTSPELAKSDLGKDLMTIVSIMGKDMPVRYWEYVEQQDHTWWSSFSNMIRLGLAIDKRETDHQLRMWHKLCELAQNPNTLDLALTGMSVNYSNNIKYLVQNMQYDEIKMLINLVLKAIELFVEQPNQDDMKAGKLYRNIAEIIFILLLTRKSEDPKIAALMDSNTPQSLKMADAIEQIMEDCTKRGISIKTFVKFKLSKPASRKAVPDLLYAVHMYLTGDDGTADIQITGIDTSV